MGGWVGERLGRRQAAEAHGLSLVDGVRCSAGRCAAGFAAPLRPPNKQAIPATVAAWPPPPLCRAAYEPHSVLPFGGCVFTQHAEGMPRCLSNTYVASTSTVGAPKHS